MFTIKNLKLAIRYIILGFILYLAAMVTSIEYINSFEDSKDGVLQVIIGAIFGALTMILNFHFNSKVDKDA